MARKISGKVYTEHALMDEAIYECKRILSGIVIKNDELANFYESQNSIDNFEALKLIHNNLATFDNFPFTYEELRYCGYGTKTSHDYLLNRYLIPENERDRVLEYSKTYVLNEYEEENKYYRTLIGLPPLTVSGDSDFYIPYYTNNRKMGYSSVIPQDFIDSKWYIDEDTGERVFGIDTTLPLHKQSPEVINIIQSVNGIKTLREYYKGSNYTYIEFLGDRKIDLYSARIAPKWDILYMPKVNEIISDNFIEFYNINKELYLKQTYQEAYKYESEYFDQMLIVSVLCQTFTDIIVNIPEMYIRRDIFDLRSVKYFLDSYGVDYYPEIPLRFQIKIVKKLNTLIKYKSSNRNIEDILNIFNSKDTAIYKYYLFKRQLTNGTKYITSKGNNKNYELQFIMSKLGDSYDNYIKENIYRKPYDDITLLDKYWDGENKHSVVRDRILAKDFTIQGTKYMSVDFTISSTEYLEQLQFFVGLIVDSNTNMDDFKVNIPQINESSDIRVSDLFLFLIAISDIYEGYEQKINLPEDVVYPWDVNSGKDWIEKYYTDINGGHFNNDDSEYERIINGDRVPIDRGTVWQVGADGGDNPKDSEIRMHDELLDWKKYWYSQDHRKTDYIAPGMYETRHNYIFGFNDVDLNQLASIIGQRHSRFGFSRGYTLKELGIDGYISPGDVNISDGGQLYQIYQNNIKIYRELRERMTGRFYSDDDYNTIKASNEDEYRVMEYVFRTLFNKKIDYNRYKFTGMDAKTLGEVLLNRDYTLYTFYNDLRNETNIEIKKENIRAVIDNILNVLEYYINGEGINYIYNFCSVMSFDSILRYVLMLVNFFKSFKVQFLDPYVTFVLDNYIDNGVTPVDSIKDMTEDFVVADYPKEDETVNINEIYPLIDDVFENGSQEEAMSISAFFDPDPYDDYDYDGQGAGETRALPKIADGRYPDDTSQFPYVMLNGGTPQRGMLAIWDLDGMSPRDFNYEWLDIDGGYAYNSYNDIYGWFGTQGFDYVLDGGPPAMNYYKSRTLDIVIKDNRISADVLISKTAYNRIELKDDGLYMEDIWQNYTDYAKFVQEYNTYLVDTMNYIYEQADRIEPIMNKYDAIPDTIDNILYEDYTKNIYKVIDGIDDDEVILTAKRYTDQEVYDMHLDYDNFTVLGFWNRMEDN